MNTYYCFFPGTWSNLDGSFYGKSFAEVEASFSLTAERGYKWEGVTAWAIYPTAARDNYYVNHKIIFFFFAI